MTKDKALKLALEALEEFGEHYDWCHQFPTYAFPENYPPCNCGYDEAINAIKEALAQPEQEPVAWQPIETAPKKEVKILLRSFSGLISEGYFLRAAYNGVGGWVWPYIHQNPVHWMPLPPPPIHNIKENT